MRITFGKEFGLRTDTLGYLVKKTFMLINLRKNFCFNRLKDVYQVGYVFERESRENTALHSGDVCLVVTFSKNGGDEITDKTNKASAMLSQSNENIQQLIESKILSYN